jgi:hypothetical protein
MFDGVLFVAIVTDDGHVTTLLFDGEPLEALRAALASTWTDRQIEPVA